MDISSNGFWAYFKHNLKDGIITGILGGGFGGLSFALVVALTHNYFKPSIFLMGLGYYPLLGLACGIIFGILLSIINLVLMRGQRIKHTKILLFIALAIIPLGPASYPVFLKMGLMFNKINFLNIIIYSIILTILWVFYLFIVLIMKKIGDLLRLSWIKFGYMIYISLTILLTLLLLLLPSKSNYFDPYNEGDNTKLANRPNVFLIIIDTLRYDWISPYGYDIKTPNLQSFSDDGILFTNMFSQCSWTRPSVSSFMTSLYPSQHGVETYTDILNPNSKTLALSMRKAGYYTVGFCNNFHLLAAYNFSIGFNYYEYLSPSDVIPVDKNAPKLDFVALLRENSKKYLLKLKPKNAVNYYYYDAFRATDRVTDWLSKNRNKKFFMFIHYMDPHVPYFRYPYDGNYYDPPSICQGNIYSADEVADFAVFYRQEIEYLDKGLGRLFDYLKNQGIYDNSLIIITADHGEEFFDHGGAAHGRTLYDEMTHIPLIIKLPYSEKRGTIDRHLVQSIDIAPTIANLVGSQIFNNWQGKDIFSKVKTKWSIAQLMKSKRATAIRSLTEKLYLTYNTDETLPPVAYFNLVKDPKELNNLADNPVYKKRIIELQDTLNYLNSTLAVNASRAKQIELDGTTKDRLKALGYIE